MSNVDIDIEQCRENDKIKEIISKSGLPIKHIKLLLRLSDTIYINSINYNVNIGDNKAIILLISSKPQNETGKFNTLSLGNVYYKLRDIEKENDDLETYSEVTDGLLKIVIDVKY